MLSGWYNGVQKVWKARASFVFKEVLLPIYQILKKKKCNIKHFNYFGVVK